MAKEQKMKFKIISLGANEKATGWIMKIKASQGLPEAKPYYDINIVIDDDYFTQKISEIKEEIVRANAKPDMFDDHKLTIASLEDNIGAAEQEKINLSELEIDDFAVTVNQADFKKDILSLEISDDVIIDIIKLRRENVKAFLVNLK